jgi:hypothetical protein
VKLPQIFFELRKVSLYAGLKKLSYEKERVTVNKNITVENDN